MGRKRNAPEIWKTCGIVRLKVLNLPTKASKMRPCPEIQVSHKKSSLFHQESTALWLEAKRTNRTRASSIEGWSTPFSKIGSTYIAVRNTQLEITVVTKLVGRAFKSLR